MRNMEFKPKKDSSAYPAKAIFNSCLTKGIASASTWVRNIWGFFILLIPQNERKIYYFCSVSFAQLVYFWREVCLFWMIKFTIMFFWHDSLKKYTSWAKLTEQTNIFFSCCEGMRGEKIKYFAPVKLVFEKSFAMIIGFKVPV